MYDDEKSGQAWGEAIGPFFTWESLVSTTGRAREYWERAASDGQLLVVTTADGIELIPDFQIDESTNELFLPIADTVKRLNDHGVNPWNAASWLTAANDDLDGDSPLKRLVRGGDRSDVVEAVDLNFEYFSTNGASLTPAVDSVTLQK